MVLDCALRRGAERPELLSATRKGRGCRRAERSILFADGDAESPGESLSRVRMYEGCLLYTSRHEWFVRVIVTETSAIGTGSGACGLCTVTSTSAIRGSVRQLSLIRSARVSIKSTDPLRAT